MAQTKEELLELAKKHTPNPVQQKYVADLMHYFQQNSDDQVDEFNFMRALEIVSVIIEEQI